MEEFRQPKLKHIYYNVDKYNNTQTIQSSRSTQNRTSQVLDKPSKYKLAVVRFQFSTLSIPIMNYSNDWYITLSYAGNNYTRQLIYEPDDAFITNEQPINHYSTVMRMINTAFQNAYNDMSPDPANPATPALEAPRMIFNNYNSKFSVLYPSTGYDLGNTIGVGVQVYFNYQLFSLFDNFPKFRLYNGRNFNADFRDVRLLVLRTGDNVINMTNPPASYFGSVFDDTLLTQPEYLMMTQTFATLNFWSPFNKIIITVPSLGARAEWLTNYNADGQEVSYPILTDFEIDFSSHESARNIYTYNPAGEYRYIDLMGDSPLFTVETVIFYQNQRTGELKEVQLLPNQGYSIKMMFEEKAEEKIKL